VNFGELVELMVDADLQRVQQERAGEESEVRG